MVRTSVITEDYRRAQTQNSSCILLGYRPRLPPRVLTQQSYLLQDNRFNGVFDTRIKIIDTYGSIMEDEAKEVVDLPEQQEQSPADVEEISEQQEQSPADVEEISEQQEQSPADVEEISEQEQSPKNLRLMMDKIALMLQVRVIGARKNLRSNPQSKVQPPNLDKWEGK